ncbi:MAG: zinc metallopeptidase [Verrucomicrobia bacterium]|nr:zinc metallopeptidase [Verrucomicrobiota bacterium]MDA1067825.1 zinc metallopeptidase [Verrucomicrobiota bacterium]
MIHTTQFAFMILPGGSGIILFIAAFAFAMWAQAKVKSAYHKYSKVPSRGGITGYEAAEAVMRKAGITNVEIVQVPGVLTDHYDPVNRRLALSDHNYRGSSLAAIGVAAHEAGHAIQHKVGYSMMNIRQTMAPVVNIAAGFLPIVIFGGLVLRLLPWGLAIDLGIIIYALLTLFHLVTLPVEFDATKRAKLELDSLGIISADEAPGVAKTLDAAGWTYVAAFASSLMNLVYLILIRGRN